MIHKLINPFKKTALSILFTMAFAGRKVYRQLARPVTIGVRAILVQENMIVLVRHHHQPYWVLPGGLVKRGESLRMAAIRELKEETGCVAEVERLLGIYSTIHQGMTIHTAVFVCHSHTQLRFRSNFEIAEVRAWPINELPPSTGMIEDRLAEYLSGARGLDMGA